MADAAVRDPADPQRLRPGYDPGDRLHFDDAGTAAVAGAVDEPWPADRSARHMASARCPGQRAVRSGSAGLVALFRLTTAAGVHHRS